MPDCLLDMSAHFPVSHYDTLCLLRVFIWEMGSGKTVAGSSFALGVLRAGFSCFALDVADGQLVDRVRDGLPTGFPKDHIVVLDVGNLEHPIPLDWSEVALGGRRLANRRAAQFCEFYSRFTDDPGGRTRRWIKKAAEATGGDIFGSVLILISDAYRRERLKKIEDPMVKIAWEQFDAMTHAAQRQLAEPVMNRIDYLLDDDPLPAAQDRRPRPAGHRFPAVGRRRRQGAVLRRCQDPQGPRHQRRGR